MAAFIIRHVTCNPSSISTNIFVATRRIANKSSAVEKYSEKPVQTLESFETSLSSRGFLRAQKSYTPPKDVQTRLENIIKSLCPKQDWNTKLEDPKLKFQLLSTCFKEFEHSVPNSMLHIIHSLDDVLQFYNTTVTTTTPLEALKNMELPPNLHVLQDYHRFHPDTDTMFGGISAYPGSSTIVTGLKYKKKYPGYKAKPNWH